MTIETKFGGWFSGEMHDEIVLVDYQYCKTDRGLGCPLNAGIKDFLSHDDPDSPMILMQYIGFRDKNGKGQEVYVDDIARDGLGQVFVIEWDYPLLARLQEIWFEVVGNIHENPGLK